MKFGILLSMSLVFSSGAFAKMVSDVSNEPEVAVETPAAPKGKTETSSLADDSLPVAAQPDEKAKSEDEIPVNFNKVKKSETAEASTGRLFLTFGLMAVFLGLGYYAAKKYGKPKNSAQTKIKILTQHYLGPKRSLAIVRVAGESILIGITDQNINMIKSLSLLDDEIPEVVSSDSFESTLNEKKEMNLDGTTTGPNTRRQNFQENAIGNVGVQANKEAGDEFSIRHIKDVVSLKLKGMRGDV
jgi:flagellar protein FliO/FliZ